MHTTIQLCKVKNIPYFFFIESIVQNVWKRLRENFRKALAKRKLKKSGAGASEELPTCGYFNQLYFLADSIGNRPTVSNISIASPHQYHHHHLL